MFPHLPCFIQTVSRPTYCGPFTLVTRSYMKYANSNSKFLVLHWGAFALQMHNNHGQTRVYITISIFGFSDPIPSSFSSVTPLWLPMFAALLCFLTGLLFFLFTRCTTCRTCSSPGWSRPRPHPPPSRRSCSHHPTSLSGTTTTTWCERGHGVFLWPRSQPQCCSPPIGQ